MDILSVQTVCIGYQQMTKVAASNEKKYSHKLQQMFSYANMTLQG